MRFLCCRVDQLDKRLFFLKRSDTVPLIDAAIIVTDTMHKGLRENKDYNEKKKTRDLIDKKCIEKKYNLGSLACPDKDN